MMKVTVYSSPTCPWCVKVEDWLKENKIEFERIDISKDKEKALEMIMKSGQVGVPVIDVDGEFVAGFDEAKLKELLKI